MNRSLIKVAKIATSILCYFLAIAAISYCYTTKPINWFVSMFWFLLICIITSFIALNTSSKVSNSGELKDIIYIALAYICLGVFNYSGLASTKSIVINLIAIIVSLEVLVAVYVADLFY